MSDDTPDYMDLKVYKKILENGTPAAKTEAVATRVAQGMEDLPKNALKAITGPYSRYIRKKRRERERKEAEELRKKKERAARFKKLLEDASKVRKAFEESQEMSGGSSETVKEVGKTIASFIVNPIYGWYRLFKKHKDKKQAEAKATEQVKNTEYEIDPEAYDEVMQMAEEIDSGESKGSRRKRPKNTNYDFDDDEDDDNDDEYSLTPPKKKPKRPKNDDYDLDEDEDDDDEFSLFSRPKTKKPKKTTQHTNTNNNEILVARR